MKYFNLLFCTFFSGFVFAQDSLLLVRETGDSCGLRFSGHVEDLDTKEKLMGATVSFSGAANPVTTDEKGDFVFPSVCAGTYELLITHVHCEPMRQTITIGRSRHQDFFLPHAMNTLGEVVVQGRNVAPSTGLKQELSGRRLEEAKSFSLGEALTRINGVAMLQTGANISKPVIHGLHGSRILTINNGVRQEGQQWGNEHAPEIDVFIADKLSVIKGVDELRYGSDAIGAVVLIQPRALRSTPGHNLEINSGYFTNNRQYYASAIFEQQSARLPALTYRLQGTYKRAGNMSAPDYRMNNTALREANFSVTAGWKKEGFNTELYYSLFSTQAGIFVGSHIGNFEDLERAIAAPRPDAVFLGQDSYRIGRPYQQVLHQLVKSRSQLLVGGHKFNLLLAAQLNNRKEYDVSRNPTARPQLNLGISTFSEELNWEHKPVNGFTGVLGIAAMQQDNAYSGRYFIPNYQSYTNGLYLIEKWSKHNWDLQAGLRYDHKSINTNRVLRGVDSSFDNYSFRFSTFAASGNAGYRITERWKTNLGISLSTRAPYVNELLSNGIHHGTATYEVGDLLLRPEQALNLSLNTSYHNKQGSFLVDLNIYRNRIHDFIYRQPRPDEPVLTIAGAFPKIIYRQTDAVLSGADLSIMIKPVELLEWTSRASVLRARNTREDDWLILMPADRFSTEFLYNLPGKGNFSKSYISAEWARVLKQTRVPDERGGRQDYKEAPAAYSLVNLNISSTYDTGKLPLTLTIGVRNLFNRSYRDYLNGMRYFADEMGRNVHLGLKMPLSFK